MSSPAFAQPVSRRSFLAGTAAGAGLLGLSATGCSPKGSGSTSSDLTFWKPPVGELKWDGGHAPAASGVGAEDALWTRVRQQLVDIQFGRAEDSFGWMHRIC